MGVNSNSSTRRFLQQSWRRERTAAEQNRQNAQKVWKAKRSRRSDLATRLVGSNKTAMTVSSTGSTCTVP
eukprot:1114385-Pleurochrysis_carterae.AAC.1